MSRSIPLQDHLSALKDKVVTITMLSGKCATGTIQGVGAIPRHVKEIQGTEAFDALISIDKITDVQAQIAQNGEKSSRSGTSAFRMHQAADLIFTRHGSRVAQ